MAEKIVAIIPARGGSKGIPRKNIRALLGKPLIAYSIEAAKASAYVQRVLVSTDDAEIAEVSRCCGAEVIHRPGEISGDTASSESALLHALTHLEQVESYHPDILVFLQCTSPLTLPEDIDGTVAALLSEKADTALAVAPSHSFLWRRDETGEAVGVNHRKAERLRRQEREPEYVETGAVYALRVDGFLHARHRFFGKTVMYVMPQDRRFEIDEPADFEMVALMMKTRTMDSGELSKRSRSIKLFVCDVDGVLTDAGMYYSEAGDELKKFNTRDGVGLERLRKSGIRVGLMTRENVGLVERRAKKLKVDFLKQGVLDKGACLEQLVVEAGVSLEEVCFVGDDIYDISALRKAGLACCPADACDEVRDVCHCSLTLRGGEGCVREIADIILNAQRTVASGTPTP